MSHRDDEFIKKRIEKHVTKDASPLSHVKEFKMSDKGLIYIHGKGGSASTAEGLKPIFSGYDVLGFDYKADNPWEAETEFRAYFEKMSKEYKEITVVASSLGAYFSMVSKVEEYIQNAFLISPVVDMERLIKDMMEYAQVTDDELRKKETITVSEEMVLSWEYLTWVRNHPITWNAPTHILYGEKDHLQSRETIEKFAKSAGSDLTIMTNGEHWFHTEEQLAFMREWFEKCEETNRKAVKAYDKDFSEK